MDRNQPATLANVLAYIEEQRANADEASAVHSILSSELGENERHNATLTIHWDSDARSVLVFDADGCAEYMDHSGLEAIYLTVQELHDEWEHGSQGIY